MIDWKNKKNFSNYLEDSDLQYGYIYIDKLFDKLKEKHRKSVHYIGWSPILYA